MGTSPTDPDDRFLLWVGFSALLHLAVAAALPGPGTGLTVQQADFTVQWVALATPVPAAAFPRHEETAEPEATVATAPKQVDRAPSVPRGSRQPNVRANAGRPEPRQSDSAEVSAGKLPEAVLSPERWPGLSMRATDSKLGSAGGDRRGEGSDGSGWGDGTGRGTGLVPIPVVERRIEEEGRRVVARDRVARGLVSPELNAVSTRMESEWRVTHEDLQRWPVRPETRVEYYTPEGAGEDVPATSCTYQRYSLARVRVTIDRDGSLVSSEIVRSSGSRRLNREVLDLVRKSAPFPPPPEYELDASGTVSGVWDVGVRDYSRSSCFFFHRSKVVKDIVFLGSY